MQASKPKFALIDPTEGRTSPALTGVNDLYYAVPVAKSFYQKHWKETNE